MTKALPSSTPIATSQSDLLTEHSAALLRRFAGLPSAKEIPHRIGIGHRRFSLVDVSAAGHQPFWWGDTTVCVAFNGEIYNYVELREELEKEGIQFRTTSDTEVLAAAYQLWGLACFQRFNGFWAVTLYDRKRRQLLLARDRIGKAPLYVTRRSDGLYWASEIKGLFAMLGASEFAVHERAVVDFVKWHRRDLFHETFYRDICTFPNAAYAWIESDGSYRPVEYWKVPDRRLCLGEISVQEAQDRLAELLEDAVRIRLRADVPVSVQLVGEWIRRPFSRSPRLVRRVSAPTLSRFPRAKRTKSLSLDKSRNATARSSTMRSSRPLRTTCSITPTGSFN